MRKRHRRKAVTTRDVIGEMELSIGDKNPRIGISRLRLGLVHGEKQEGLKSGGALEGVRPCRVCGSCVGSRRDRAGRRPRVGAVDRRRKNGIHISRRRLRRLGGGKKHVELKGVDGVVYVIVTRAGLWRRG